MVLEQRTTRQSKQISEALWGIWKRGKHRSRICNQKFCNCSSSIALESGHSSLQWSQSRTPCACATWWEWYLGRQGSQRRQSFQVELITSASCFNSAMFIPFAKRLKVQSQPFWRTQWFRRVCLSSARLFPSGILLSSTNFFQHMSCLILYLGALRFGPGMQSLVEWFGRSRLGGRYRNGNRRSTERIRSAERIRRAVCDVRTWYN